MAIPSLAFADTIVVDGVTCTLASAIVSANTDAASPGCTTGNGHDTIQINTTQTNINALPTVISDVDFVNTGGGTVIISGNGSHRLMMIGDETHAPSVTISKLWFAGGNAHGGNASGGGGGAGLGGALFIYDGTVSIDHASFTENGAYGGASSGGVTLHSGGGGGGGLFGGGGTGAPNNQINGGGGTAGGEFGGGGGGGGNSYFNEGGGGDGGDGSGPIPGSGGKGFAQTLPTLGGFGGGGGGGGAHGQLVPSQAGADGGFGGGGGGGGGSGTTGNVDTPGAGANGGFGGGGGAGGSSAGTTPGGAGGMGGFGGGGGGPGAGSIFGPPGLGGFGGGDTESGGGGGGGAGFGAAIFVRSGHVNLTNSDVSGNNAVRGTGASLNGLAKGGGIFVLSSLTNANGNDEGMPAALPTVSGCGNTFSSNFAADAGVSNRDNVDVYGVDRVVLKLACGDGIFADGFGTP